MSFDRNDFLALADELTRVGFQKSSRDAVYRTAISRAYYAAHHKAREKLSNSRPYVRVPTAGSVHEWLINQYKFDSSLEARRIAADLAQLKVWRNKADYDSSWAGAGNQYHGAIRMGSNVLERLRVVQL